MVANRVHGGGGNYSKWSVPFIPLAPRPLSTPISSPLFLLQETVYEGYLFSDRIRKKRGGGGEWEDNVTALCASSERW